MVQENESLKLEVAHYKEKLKESEMEVKILQKLMQQRGASGNWNLL